MQLAKQRREDERYNRKEETKRIMKAKEANIHDWASSHNLCEPEQVKTVIMTYMLETLENDKQLDFKQLLRLLGPYLPQHQPTEQTVIEHDLVDLRIVSY